MKNQNGPEAGTKAIELCDHLQSARPGIQPQANGCVECLKSGDEWVHLRLCLQCGHVGCCDSSKNHHATRHYHETQHPVIQSFQPGENWTWCYIDQKMSSLEKAA